MDNIIERLEAMVSSGPLVVGINGLDCSGKTTFVRTLYEKLIHRNVNCRILHIDDYNNRAVQKMVYDAYQKGNFSGALLNRYYAESIHYDAVQAAIKTARQKYDVTLIEGVFLFKDCLNSSLDVRIFLPIDPSVARARYEKRKLSTDDARPIGVFDDIWLPTYERYVREVCPQEMSDFIHEVF